MTMLPDLLKSLIESTNEAADDVLLEALRLGVEAEQMQALHALLRRRTVHGLSGVVRLFGQLPASVQWPVLRNVRLFHPALRECGRSRDPAARLGAMRLIALGKQGKLTYVLSEGLHGADEEVAKAACEALVALARWVATETRRLQAEGPWRRGSERYVSDAPPVAGDDPVAAAAREPLTEGQLMARQILEERPEIEAAVARALEVHRGKFGPDLLRAALLLADSPLSRTLAVLGTAKHAGQAALVRRLQQPPDSEHVEAFLLAASRHGLRSNFGVVFSHIAEPPVLDALLRRTHWLKDQALQLCMHQVTRGAWWTESELARDLGRRDAEDAARVGEWIAASGTHDVLQDALLERLREQCDGHLAGRLRLLRIAMRRPRAGASVQLVRAFLSDPDERLARLAAREIVRRRPAEFENVLIQAMAGAPESVRRVISRSVGRVGFEHYWERFERMDRSTRKAAGKAMLKVLPDGLARLERRLRGGPVEQRLRALAITHELGVADAMGATLMQMCTDPHPKVRSKAVALLAELTSVPPDLLLERVLNDADARVRANAIEVLEAKRRTEFVPLLTTRARTGHSRERANAIKAMARMRLGVASGQLLNMLQDERPEHRISAMWAMRQIGLWQMLREVGRIAKEDPNLRVRRYAMNILRGVAELLRQRGTGGDAGGGETRAAG